MMLYSTATAQDTPGLEANLSLSQGLTYSDVDGTLGRMNLGFGLTSVTRTQTFSFDISGALEQDFENGVDFDIVRPSAALAYVIESRQTAINTDVSYRRSDADDFVTDPNGAPGVLILDEGLREDMAAGLDVALGTEALFGGTFNLGYRETAFSNSTSTDLIDEKTTDAGLNLRFEIDQQITATLGYNWSQTDRASDRNTTDERLSTGLEMAVTPTLNANASIGLGRISVTDSGVETVEDGLSYDLSVIQERPNGELRFSLESDLSETGRRTTAQIGTTFETRHGEFSADLGITKGEADDIRPIVTFGYSEDLARGGYSVSLQQKFNTTSSGEETLNSRLRLNFNQDLNNTSRIASDLTYQITNVSGADDDSARLQLGLSFSQDLTSDWALTTRYTYSFEKEDGAATERENELFIGLETLFVWRP
jgi:hypothetical protein